VARVVGEDDGGPDVPDDELLALPDQLSENQGRQPGQEIKKRPMGEMKRRIVAAIAACPKIRNGQLAEELGVEHSNISHHTKGLLESGIIERREKGFVLAKDAE